MSFLENDHQNANIIVRNGIIERVEHLPISLQEISEEDFYVTSGSASAQSASDDLLRYLHQEYNHEYREYFEMISSLNGYPSRQMCASLPWKAWDQLINKDVR